MLICMNTKVKRSMTNPKLQILIVAARYLPHQGGLETVVKEISHFFESSGHKVSIVTNRYPRNLPRNEKINGVNVTRFQFIYPQIAYIRSKKLMLWLASWILFPVSLVQFGYLLFRLRPDIVNAHYIGNTGLFLLILHSIFGFNLVVSLHGGDVDGEPHQSRFKLWQFRSLLHRASRVTVCSSALLKEAMKLTFLNAEKTTVIHNGADLNLFSRAMVYSHPQPYLLAVGQLERHKGFDLLISAFSQIAKEYVQYDLILAGEGSEREILVSMIRTLGLKGRIHLLGSQSQTSIASLMRGSRIVVVPSRREPFGIVAIEARASGKPIIASNVGGLPEALEGSGALLIQPGNPSSLANAIRTVLSSPNGQQTDEFITEFDWKVVGQKYLEVLYSSHENRDHQPVSTPL